jgi:hypothetical protein
MSNLPSQEAALSLIRVMKQLSREWRSFRQTGDDETAGADWPNKYLGLPIWTLARLIEQSTSFTRGDIEWAAYYIDRPVDRTPAKPPEDAFIPPDLGIEELGVPTTFATGASLHNLRSLREELNECDTDGRTAEILRELEAKHPRVLNAILAEKTEQPSGSGSLAVKTAGDKPGNRALFSHDYKNDAYWRDPFTLGHLIYVSQVYEELKAKDSAPGRENAVRYDSAEAASRIETYHELMRVSSVLVSAPGIDRIKLHCDKLEPRPDNPTVTNLVKLRVKICDAKPCTIQEADALPLDEAADVLSTVGVTPSGPPPEATPMEKRAIPPAPPKKDVPLPPETIAIVKANLAHAASLATSNTAVHELIYGHLPFIATAEQPATVGQALTLAPSDSPTEATETPGDSTDWKAVIAAVVDENAVAIISMAGDASKTTDQKMRAIHAIDNRVVGWDSPKWASVLHVSDAAVRKTDWWKNDRPRLRG